MKVESEKKRQAWELYADGAARGNPGPAGIGFVLLDSRGRVVRAVAEHIGEATNNVAEYRALLAGLEEAVAQGCNRLGIFSDSELIVRQLQGQYRVRQGHLLPLYQRARELLERMEDFSLQHVPREANQQADWLANLGAGKNTGKR